MEFLRIGGWLNILIGVGHVVSLVRARESFEWVGIGPDMDRLARIHPSLPYLMTLAAAAAFVAFGLYALSAAGDVRPLPMIVPVICGIAVVYLVRAVGGSGQGGFFEDSTLKERVFSSIALIIGLLYAAGARALIKGG